MLGGDSTVLTPGGVSPSACSSRNVSALKTSEHRPQRTRPCAARSMTPVTRKTVWHCGHCVNKSATLPVQAHPRIASGERAHIKPWAASQCHGSSLRFEDSREGHHTAGAHQGGKTWRQLDQWVRENVGDEHIDGCLGVFGRPDSQALADLVAPRILLRGDEGLRIDVNREQAPWTQFQCCDAENPGTAAEVDHLTVLHVDGIEPFEAHRRGGVSASAEGKTGIQ